jgi:hypothetical protein
MLRHCQSSAPASFIAAGLACTTCVEITRTITERSEMGEVKVYVAGPNHAGSSTKLW